MDRPQSHARKDREGAAVETWGIMPDCQEIGSSSQTPTGKQKEVWPKVKLSAHASHREPVEGLNLLISSNSRDNAAADATVCVAATAAITSPYG